MKPIRVLNNNLIPKLAKFTKMSFFVQAASSLVKTVAEVCFRSESDSYITNSALACGAGTDTEIVNQMVAQCGAANDPDPAGEGRLFDFCPDLGTSTMDICKGLFAGTRCQLTHYQEYTPSDCIVNVIEQNCHDGYGTGLDALVTVAICIGGVIVIGCCIGGIISYSNANKPESAAVNLNLSEENMQHSSDSSPRLVNNAPTLRDLEVGLLSSGNQFPSAPPQETDSERENDEQPGLRK